MSLRFGIELGGSKIEIVALDEDGRELLLLTDESHQRFGARLYDGHLVSDGRIVVIGWSGSTRDSYGAA